MFLSILTGWHLADSEPNGPLCQFYVLLGPNRLFAQIQINCHHRAIADYFSQVYSNNIAKENLQMYANEMQK